MRLSSLLAVIAVFAVVTAAPLAAQCTWTAAPSSGAPITETCASVGVMTTTPKSTLHVGAGADSPTLGTNNAIYASNLGPTFITARDSANHVELTVGTASLGGGAFAGLFGTRTMADLYLQGNSSNYVVLKAASGNFGIGTTDPKEVLHLEAYNNTNSSTTGLNMRLARYANLGTMAGTWSTVLGSNVRAGVGSDPKMQVVATATGAAAIVLGGTSGIDFHTLGDPVTANADFTTASRMNISPGGVVTIGSNIGETANMLIVKGGITANGVIGAKWQDVAEWVPASVTMTPGTVVVLNPEHNNEVMPSAEAYDTSVAGVVSERPGVILGEGSASKAQIATTGRVKVHVDASEHAVRIGDLLVTSGRSGFAMKSIPMEINGRKFHQPGTVVGKALEPLASGQGDILVLLSLQ
jgi:hypothetical protein